MRCIMQQSNVEWCNQTSGGKDVCLLLISFQFVFLTNILDVSIFSGQECNSYILNEEIDRSVTHATTGSSHKCDKTLATGWYRFNSTSGFKMPTTRIAPNKCNTHATGLLNGTHQAPRRAL